MSENSENEPKNGSKSGENQKTILSGSGISYAQIPRNLFKLTECETITYSDAFLALRMFDWCHQKGKFPKFSVTQSELAKVTRLSRRQVQYGLDRLIDLRVVSVRHGEGCGHEYQWNEYFLQTGHLTSANFAHEDVKTLHMACAEYSHGDVQSLRHIYIEFLLDYLSRLFLEYFSNPAPLKKRVPPRRGQKGVAKDFATVYTVTRRDAWKEAIEASIVKGGYVRTYVALAGGFNIDQVAYPRAYLLKVIWDESRQWESRKKSYLAKQGHLDSDETLLKFLAERNKKTTEETETATLDDLNVELTYMSGRESAGEEMHG